MKFLNDNDPVTLRQIHDHVSNHFDKYALKQYSGLSDIMLSLHRKKIVKMTEGTRDELFKFRHHCHHTLRSKMADNFAFTMTNAGKMLLAYFQVLKEGDDFHEK